MTLKREIIIAIDTGASMQSIIKDILGSTDEYTEEQIVQEINQMLELGVIEDRGQYFVFMYRDKKAIDYVYGVDK